MKDLPLNLCERISGGLSPRCEAIVFWVADQYISGAMTELQARGYLLFSGCLKEIREGN